MKPLPPIWSASAQAMIASARRARRWNESVIHPLREAQLTSQPPARPNAHANENPETHLLQGEAYPDACGQVLLLGLCQGQEERQKGYGEAVVEPGLDVQGLANAGRDARVAHHRLAKRGVGGGEDDSHDGRLPEGEIGEHQRRDNGSQHDG